MSFGKRPELSAPPEIFYNETEAEKYTKNSRIIEIQSEMAERALELLELDEDEPQMILDIGCGSGLSGSVLDEEGHFWIGTDISSAMITVGREKEVGGDMVLSDMGQGLHFRPGTFDAAISISALQWLCNADKSSHKPTKRLNNFFTTLHGVLNTGGKAVFQFYPSDDRQIDLITSQAKRVGFNGGLVIDYPNSKKAKKYYLVLTTGVDFHMPKPLAGDGEERVTYSENKRGNHKRGKGMKSVKDWIQEKKERRRRQGRETRSDSKFTGRKRCGKF